MIDILGALLGLMLAAPLLLATAAMVRLSIGAPVLFRQKRPGVGGKPFWIYKFRTMLNATDPQGNTLPDGDRLTRFGLFLRRTSLDELPELYNVLRGDMSLVGPRPLLMQYLDRYTNDQARRNDVKPGITGWAQVNGRNAITWEEKFALDVWYVDHYGMLLDLRILFMTVCKVFRREGISAQSHATMPEFKGSDQVNKCQDAK
jgi:lipopolysaccharide/colanic/teichoic acid biosynthesis glycosyltransferase